MLLTLRATEVQRKIKPMWPMKVTENILLEDVELEIESYINKRLSPFNPVYMFT